MIIEGFNKPEKHSGKQLANKLIILNVASVMMTVIIRSCLSSVLLVSHSYPASSSLVDANGSVMARADISKASRKHV